MKGPSLRKLDEVVRAVNQELEREWLGARVRIAVPNYNDPTIYTVTGADFGCLVISDGVREWGIPADDVQRIESATT